MMDIGEKGSNSSQWTFKTFYWDGFPSATAYKSNCSLNEHGFPVMKRHLSPHECQAGCGWAEAPSKRHCFSCEHLQSWAEMQRSLGMWCVQNGRVKSMKTRNGMYRDVLVIVFFLSFVFMKVQWRILLRYTEYRSFSWVFMVGNQIREREN